MKKIILITGLAVLVVGSVYYAYFTRNINHVVLNTGNNCGSFSIHDLKERRLLIEADKDRYTSNSKDIYGRSTEGGLQVEYRLGNEIKLIEQVFYGETGKSETSYYVSGGKVFYFIRKNFQYLVPLYLDTSGTVKSVETREFYLNDNQELCFWYLDGQLQPNSEETADIVNFLISEL